MTPENIKMGLQILLGVITLLVLASVFFTVEEQEVAVVERFGKFHRLAQPGLRARIPGVDTIADRVTLQTVPLELEVSTKTKDNVFVTLRLSVQ